jgi:hypothetical protein
VLEKVQKSERLKVGTTLERLQRSRRVVEDFTIRTLAAIPSAYGRLYYVNSLRNTKTGSYEHDGLAELYSGDSVQEALTQCHEELFSRILETPLQEQEGDLRKCLEDGAETILDAAEYWRGEGVHKKMCPEALPSYLNDLFYSNVNVLLSTVSS